jgi:hypothetical protein
MAQPFSVHFIGIILYVMNFRPYSINPFTVIIKMFFLKERLLLEYCLTGVSMVQLVEGLHHKTGSSEFNSR